MSTANKRFSAFEWSVGKLKIQVIGCGMIGSWMALYLSRIGHLLELWDHDLYSVQNISAQFCGVHNISNNKATALAQNIKLFSGSDVAVTAHDDYFIPQRTEDINDCFISAVDSMKYRKLYYEMWIKKQMEHKVNGTTPKHRFFIDFRSSPQHSEFFLVTNGIQAQKYASTLFSDDDAEELPCNAKATTHNATLITSLGMAAINNLISNNINGYEVFDVPFHVYVDLQQLDVRKEYVQSSGSPAGQTAN